MNAAVAKIPSRADACLRIEANILASRLALRADAVFDYLKARGLTGPKDIIHRFGGASHEKAMDALVDDFFVWGMESVPALTAPEEHGFDGDFHA